MDIEFWRNYSKTVDGLTWRAARIEDLPAIERLWEQKERVFRKKIDRPVYFFDAPTMITLVAEDEKGRIVAGAYAEVTVDVSMIGCSRKGFESMAGIAEDLAGWLKAARVRLATVVVPKIINHRLGSVLKLMGFESGENKAIYWRRHL